MARKKKRTPKQLAATRQLIAGNRKRLAKKKKKKKKKARRKTNTKRPSTTNTNYQIAGWSPTGKVVVFYDGVGFSKLRSSAATWHSNAVATRVAKHCRRAKCAVVTTRDSVAAIEAFLLGKK